MLLSQLRNNLTWHQFVAPGLDDMYIGGAEAEAEDEQDELPYI